MVGGPEAGLLEAGQKERVQEVEPEGGGRSGACLGASLACLIAGGIVFHGAIANALNEALLFTAGLGNWAALFIFVLTAALNLLMLPTFPIMIGAGVVFTDMYDGNSDMGGLVGTLAVFGGLWLGSMVAFMLGRKCLQDFAKKKLESHQTLQVVNGMIAESGWTIVLLARMSPLLPAEVFNYACSLVETLTPVQYGIGCLGSIVPVSFWVFSSAQTAGITQMSSNGTATGAPQGGQTLIVLNIVIVVVLTFAFYVAYKSYKKKTQEAAARVLGPRVFIASRAAIFRLESEPCLGVPYYSDRNLKMRCQSARDIVKWDEKVEGRPVPGCMDNCEWVEVDRDGVKYFLPLHCDDRQKDGLHAMCPSNHFACTYTHSLVRCTTKFGPDELVKKACVFSSFKPRIMRSFRKA